jgi:hypothetical protein
MAKRTFKKGLSHKQLAKRDEQKGKFYTDPGTRVSYIKPGVLRPYIPKDGKNKIRIIQPFEVEELGFYGMEMHFHRNVGNEGDPGYGDYLCLARMKKVLKDCYDMVIKDSCYECDQRTPELWDENPDLAKTFYPDRRMWFLVHDLNSEDEDEVFYWSCPWTLHEEIVSRSSNAETSVYRDVSDPVTGSAVSFERSGSGKLTRYTNVQIFSSELPLDEGVLDKMVEFRELLVIPTYDQVAAAANGEDADGGSSVEESSDDEQHDEQDFDDQQEEDQGEQEEEQAEQEEEQEGDGTEACFGKEFDKWQECEECHRREECKPKPEKKAAPKKTPKKAAPKKTAKVAEETVSDAGDDPGEDDIEKKRLEIRKKIEAARKKRQ